MAPRRHERRGAADRYGRHERKVGIRLCTREEPTKPQPDFERMPGYRSLPAVAITVAPAITAIGAVAARGRIAVVAIRGIAAVAVDAGRPMCWTATDGAAPALGRTRADEVALHVGQASPGRQSSSARCWSRCRPTARPASGTVRLRRRCARDGEQVKRGAGPGGLIRAPSPPRRGRGL